MLKAFIATAEWNDHAMPSGEKIILADSREEAEQIVQDWTKEYFARESQNKAESRARFEKELQEEQDDSKKVWLRRLLAGVQEDPNLTIEWKLEELPLEKGILGDTGISWLSETP